MVKHLIRDGIPVVVLDDLSGGHSDSVPNAELVVGSVGDAKLLAALCRRYKFEAVMHFASFIQVGESVTHPNKYYQNNLVSVLTLLEVMRQNNVIRLIFSSSAAVYGSPQKNAIDENHIKQPISPYGRTKYMVEQILDDYDDAYGLKSVSLRYFNAAGADSDGQLGERHSPETHLIPLVLQAAARRRESIVVFGTDYDTPDGTCIRDFVHVTDLCDAHALALGHLLRGGPTLKVNLGNGQGFSVNEVIQTAQTVTGTNFGVEYAPRRPGDPGRLVADSTYARQVLGWKPRRDVLRTIIEDAWAWELKWPWNFGRRSEI
jgi:UDP-glucose 4-epimerase